MRIVVRHTTTYQYTEPIILEPHVLRLRPRATPSHLLERYEATITPVPQGTTECLDSSGNFVTSAWFVGPADHLIVEIESEMCLVHHNPYNFIIQPPEMARLPLTYPPDLDRALRPSWAMDGISFEIRELSSQVIREVGHNTTYFLTRLCERIFTECRQVIRREGAPQEPALTWSRREGACRDLAVVFISACRAAGLAARFVSGYALDERPDDERQLHAWAEVYLPGAGWRGFDPSQGIAVAERHIALAAAPTSSLAAPIGGAYRGSARCSSFDAHIEMQFLDVETGVDSP